MTTKKNSRSEKEEKRGRVNVGKLNANKELSAAEAKEVKGGKLLEAAVKGKVFKKVEIHGTA